MRFSASRNPKITLLVIISLLILASNAPAVITHPANGALSIGLDNVMGKWGSNTSCVAVSPCHVITAKHCGTPGSVTVAGSTYKIESTWDHPSADLRIAKLSNAALAEFVGINTQKVIGQTAFIGGAGLTTGKKTGSSYQWGQKADTFNWCTNRIDSTRKNSLCGSMKSDILLADFDAPNAPDATEHEGAVAMYDSGGGWFVYDGRWTLAGITRSTSTYGKSSFAGAKTQFSAVDLSEYANWVDAVTSFDGLTVKQVPEPASVILLSLGGLIIRKRLSL